MEPEEDEPEEPEPPDLEPEEDEEPEPLDFEPDELEPLEDPPEGPLSPRTFAGSPPEELDEPDEPEEPDEREPEEPELPDEPEPEDDDEDRCAPRLALEVPDSRSAEVLAGGEAWLAGVFFADEEDEELLEEPSSPVLEDLEAEPPSETMASAESAKPKAARPPRRAASDLTGKRARSSSDEPSRSIALGSRVVVRASMACLPASGPST